MADKNTEFDRLLADEFGADDPTWGRVATFLSRVQSSAVTPSVESLEDAHVARVRASLSALGTLPRAQRRERRAAQVRRFVLAGVAGLFAVLTAGAGVAAAMGVNPIEVLSHIQLGQIIPSPFTPDPTHPVVPDPSQRPDSPQTSAPGQTGSAGQSGEDHGKSTEDHGKATEDHGKASEHANPRSTQTGKPTAANTNQSKADPTHPTGKPTTVPEPTGKKTKD